MKELPGKFDNIYEAHKAALEAFPDAAPGEFVLVHIKTWWDRIIDFLLGLKP